MAKVEIINIKFKEEQVYNLSKKTKKSSKFNPKINYSTIIERVHEFNFLGLTLHEHLTWKCHINKISNNISQCMGILNRLKHFLQFKLKFSFTILWYSHI